MYSQNEIELKFRKIIAGQLDISEDNIVNDAHFVYDLGINSLDLYEIIIESEDTFGLQIPDEVFEKIDTVQDAVSYISKQFVAQAI